MNRVTLAICTALGLILASALLPTSDVFACTCTPPQQCNSSCTCNTCTPVAGNPVYAIPLSMTSSSCVGGVTAYTLPFTDTGSVIHTGISTTLSTGYTNIPTVIPAPPCPTNSTCVSNVCVCTYNQCPPVTGSCCAMGQTCTGSGGACAYPCAETYYMASASGLINSSNTQSGEWCDTAANITAVNNDACLGVGTTYSSTQCTPTFGTSNLPCSAISWNALCTDTGLHGNCLTATTLCSGTYQPDCIYQDYCGACNGSCCTLDGYGNPYCGC